MRENQYQAKLIKRIKERFPDAMVLKNDPSYKQGIPDLTILWKDKWAALETKRSEDSPHRPNQDYYVEKMNSMSYSSFIFPENEEEVLNEMEQSFKRGARRSARNLRSK